MTDYDQRSLLNELEPEAGRLFDRHASVAQEWFPHDYIPYRLGRDFDKEPWTPDQPRLTGVAQTAFEVNLLTEDNLPSYHRLIHGMFGAGDGAWINWIGRWTAEEGRHAIVLRDYLTVTRNLDPIALERGRMTQLQQGYDRDTIDTLRGLAYVAFQELATRISHKNTGRYSQDPVADKIMTRIAADENLHMVFYRDILGAALKIQPSRAVQAIVAEVLAFEMPGISPDQIEVTTDNGVLTVRGEKREERKESDDSQFHLIERSYGAFSRSFQLPKNLDESKIEAGFDNGVLTVRIPKAALPQPKKIAVNAGSRGGSKQVESGESQGTQRMAASGRGGSKQGEIGESQGAERAAASRNESR